jgi:BirA family biotin operon repressor/biotin-[acetyl-CoA-carboxylase] ligase
LRSSQRNGPRVGRIGSTVLHFETVGSTNDVGAAYDEEGLVVVADAQTAGRGRRGHTWFSPPGAGLYVSVVLTPMRARVEPQRAMLLLTLAAGVAIAEALDATTGLAVGLKWPNDIYVGHRKLGGILAESASGGSDIGAVVLGYGINLAPAAYPPDVADRATSVETETGRGVDREQILNATLTALSHRYDDLLDGRFDAILDAWRRRAPAATGARVSWTTTAGPQSGITDGIDDAGALLVRRADRVERILSGEVTWIQDSFTTKDTKDTNQ